MKIANLDAPVVASKCDWGVATRCLSFSPANGTLTAMNKCQGNVFETFHGGYVLEYISKTMPPPNPGFDEEYARNREEHRKNAGKLWAVHRLELSRRPLWEIVGRKKFEHTQDMWARPNARHSGCHRATRNAILWGPLGVR